MRFVEPSAEILKISDPVRKIEHIGRLCYKSKSDNTDEGAFKFVKNLIDHEHYAMTEHAVFTFMLDEISFLDVEAITNKNYEYGVLFEPVTNISPLGGRYIVSANLRTINEGDYVPLKVALINSGFNDKLFLSKVRLDDKVKYDNRICRVIPDIKYFIENDVPFPLRKTEIRSLIKKHTYKTFYIITDNGATHDFVRHRKCSFAQESTRYCNYAKEKFGGELTFIKPRNFEEWDKEHKDIFYSTLFNIEEMYNKLSNEGRKPDEIRGFLPKFLKSEIIITCNIQELFHIFDLRYHEVTGAVNPTVKETAECMFNAFTKEPEATYLF